MIIQPPLLAMQESARNDSRGRHLNKHREIQSPRQRGAQRLCPAIALRWSRSRSARSCAWHRSIWRPQKVAAQLGQWERAARSIRLCSIQIGSTRRREPDGDRPWMRPAQCRTQRRNPSKPAPDHERCRHPVTTEPALHYERSRHPFTTDAGAVRRWHRNWVPVMRTVSGASAKISWMSTS